MDVKQTIVFFFINRKPEKPNSIENTVIKDG